MFVGGMKRKLSIGIAFIGGSRTVILVREMDDEIAWIVLNLMKFRMNPQPESILTRDEAFGIC